MKRPVYEDLIDAATWLDCNEGADGEAEACSRVATWLRTYASDMEIRAGARNVGCSVKYFRKYMAGKLP